MAGHPALSKGKGMREGRRALDVDGDDDENDDDNDDDDVFDDGDDDRRRSNDNETCEALGSHRAPRCSLTIACVPPVMSR